jgi:hypothetical protein
MKSLSFARERGRAFHRLVLTVGLVPLAGCLPLDGCECFPSSEPVRAGDQFRDVDPTLATQRFSAQNGTIRWLQMPHEAELRVETSPSVAASVALTNPCNDQFRFTTPIRVHLTSADGILDGTQDVPIVVLSDLTVTSQTATAQLPISDVSLARLVPVLADDDADGGAFPEHKLELTLDVVVEGMQPRFHTGKLDMIGRDRLALAELEFSP